MLTNDPAKWIVVGILACLQFTFWAWKKSRTPFAWRNIGPGLAGVLILGWFFILCPILAGQTPWASIIPIVCGLAIAGRQSGTNARFGWTFAGMFFALSFNWTTSYLVQERRYAFSTQIQWEQPPDLYLPKLDTSNMDKPFAAGYVDSIHFGQNKPQETAHLNLVLPVPLWHSSITGLYERKRKGCRIWFPDGNAEEMLRGALAVPLGTPAGSERKLGIPLDTYREPDQVEEF